MQVGRKWLGRGAAGIAIQCGAIGEAPILDTTRATLLERIRDRADGEAWRQFDAIYRPMLMRFGQGCGLDHAGAEDVTQHCMSAIHRHIDGFDYDPKKGR